mmetsp:Transcript_10008/g.20279  ORF Transcript_10008/g.20279 Transcript_10008/m.20279 type:complete len:517 (-) Transcript_10008:891-2441(-)
MLLDRVQVSGPNVEYRDDVIEASFEHWRSLLVDVASAPCVQTECSTYRFRTERHVPGKLGLLLVGWGGNNGSTLTGAVVANREGIQWRTRDGVQAPNYYGSIVMASTVRVAEYMGEEVYAPLRALLPMVHPNQLVIGGWDMNSADLAAGMRRAAVLDYDLQRQLEPYLVNMTPMPSIYYPDFIAADQADRADHVLPSEDKQKHLQQIRDDIRRFKVENELDKVIVLWTANTERFSEIIPGVNDSASNLLHSIATSHNEVSPSTIFAVASILEGCPYINGSPQNTFVPGCIELAIQENVFIAGDDFKSGQTKYKSVVTDFLVSAGFKPLSIVSYNHLGNNDGKNLSAPSQFRSKEISKSNVVDDMVASNELLYRPNESPDHVVVIKYVPSVGDSKRAMDEYTSEIFMGGRSTIVTHNTCEDSLLAAPLMLDLVLLCELCTRISYKTEEMEGFEHFHPVLSILSYLLKAPMVPDGTPVVNALFKQRAAIENLLRICVGLPPENDLRLEYRRNPGGSRK